MAPSGVGGAGASGSVGRGRAVLGSAGRGGRTDTITLLATRGNELVDLERWTSRDELCQAPEAPIWDRFGTFAGQPLVRGEVIWSPEDRSVVIRGKRGERRFEEIAA